MGPRVSSGLMQDSVRGTGKGVVAGTGRVPQSVCPSVCPSRVLVTGGAPYPGKLQERGGLGGALIYGDVS